MEKGGFEVVKPRGGEVKKDQPVPFNESRGPRIAQGAYRGRGGRP